jgi:hypothetical protein
MKEELEPIKYKDIIEEKEDGSFSINITSEQLKHIFGTDNHRFIEELIIKTTQYKSQRANIDGMDIFSTHKLFKNLNPKDEIECLLISQILNADKISHHYFRDAMTPDQTPFGKDSNTQRYAKSINSMCKLIDTLTRYKRGGQQKVVVEHVTLENGSQAIIGNVSKP